MPTTVDDDRDDAPSTAAAAARSAPWNQLRLDQARRIGADAEPGAMAERDQPGVADAAD